MVRSAFGMALSKVNNNDNEQEKNLREATRNFRGIEKPLKFGPSIGTLQELITALHKEFETNYVDIEMVNHILMSYKSNPKEWHKFAKFDRYKYTRNLVDAGNGKFNLMILCWGEGHGSAIHDHADSHCFMKILQGELVETRYEMPQEKETIINAVADIGRSSDDNSSENLNDNQLKELGKTSMTLNDVCYINDNLGLHRVENPSHTDGSVSLHLYCPPFNSCSVFQKNSGKKIECQVTFWSKYGVRQAQSNQK